MTSLIPVEHRTPDYWVSKRTSLTEFNCKILFVEWPDETQSIKVGTCLVTPVLPSKDTNCLCWTLCINCFVLSTRRFLISVTRPSNHPQASLNLEVICLFKVFRDYQELFCFRCVFLPLYGDTKFEIILCSGYHFCVQVPTFSIVLPMRNFFICKVNQRCWGTPLWWEKKKFYLKSTQ